MKILIVVLISMITVASAQDFIAGTIIKPSRRGRAADRDPATLCPNTFDIATFCVADDECTKGVEIFTCINGAPKKDGDDEIDPVACADPTPYCIGDPGNQLCSAESGPTCPSTTPKYCKAPGYFADPTNCQIYYYCYLDGTDLKEYTVQCPNGTAFNPSGPSDKKCQISGACVKANCTAGLAAEWRALNYFNYTNNRMALKCINSKMDYINICPGGLSLDTTYTPAPRCSIKCTSNYQKGVYVLDKTMYYQCLMGTASLYKCEVGKSFNPEKLECV